ncbi:DUF7687 domain-containing protein [Flavobacterium cerinum]|uniref:YqaJ viral recombinase domain-containing protein n=1 Tax=Flavobacterium cerinum TaxID=2502784 RepID=A0ABY5IZD9_9FLAO|nr:hypothetical protein [Flavobacterium cerinum]UUC47103.1 hypothetical protein NOX80_07855 [Flavobacterium cerinum]
MKPNDRFKNQPLEFWANIKILNQRLGFTKKPSAVNPQTNLVVPTVEQIIDAFKSDHLDYSKLIDDKGLTKLGLHIISYMRYRRELLTNAILPLLMTREQAQELFYSMKKELDPNCPLPLNKQKKEKKDYAYLKGIVNMLICKHKGDYNCDFSPKELTVITENNFPIRVLPRRANGVFPSVINPKAIWEIKEYYYTTTFGSRVSDSVYAAQLDGWELCEAQYKTGKLIKNYLIIDDYYTWWAKGKSYLCRLVDLMHIGLVDEVIFGREVVTRIPELVEEWKNDLETISKNQHNKTNSIITNQMSE